jgi:hypothetical protein
VDRLELDLLFACVYKYEKEDLPNFQRFEMKIIYSPGFAPVSTRGGWTSMNTGWRLAGIVRYHTMHLIKRKPFPKSVTKSYWIATIILLLYVE